MSNNIVYNAYFKLARTSQVFTYDIPYNLSIKNFILTIKEKAIENFNLPPESESNIEVVIAGQYIHNVQSEDAPAIVITTENEDNTIFSVFGDKLYNQAYYIRICTDISNNSNIIINEQNTVN